MLPLLGVACASDLLPGELVVPGELAAVSFRGADGAALGASVALDDGALLAGAPGLGQAWQLGPSSVSQGWGDLGRWVWWTAGEPFAAQASVGVFAVGGLAAEQRWETPGAVVFAAGEMADGPRVAAATNSAVQLWDSHGALQARLQLPGVQQLAVGFERLLLLACDGELCEVSAWDPGDGRVEYLAQAGPGGALVEVDGVAWWGDPQLDQPTATGVVCSEEGRCIEGLEGDHLGRRLCATHAAGVYNTWLTPARLRLVPLEEGTVLAIDRAAPSRPPALHSHGGQLAVGLPSDGLNSWGDGRVLLVELD